MKNSTAVQVITCTGIIFVQVITCTKLEKDSVQVIACTKSKLGFYVPFNSQGHIGTGPQNCHLWDSNPQR